jgi:hypothetical protein
MDMKRENKKMYNKKEYGKLVIELSPESVLDMELNKAKLEQDLKQDLAFEKQVKKNLKVLKNKTDEQDLEELKEFVWLGLDWYDLIMNFNYYAQRKMTISVYKVQIKNLKQYLPDKITSRNELIYNSETNDLEEYLFVLKDSNDPNNLNKFVERMLSTKLVKYVDAKWKLEWELTER